MKIVAFSGSARKDGNTAVLVREVFTVLEKEGIETELVQLAGETVRGCIACYQCYERKDRRCAVTGDIVNDCIDKMIAADAVILASPTYFADITPELKALIDRSGMVGRANDNLYRRKVGVAVVAARRGGAVHAFDSINHFFLIGEMIVPGSNYWNMGFGKGKEEVRQDEEGMHTMRQLGENMAWLMKKLA